MAAGDVTISGAYTVGDEAHVETFLESITNLNTGSFNFMYDINTAQFYVVAVEGA